MTNDNHPSIHRPADNPSEWTKQASGGTRATSNGLRLKRQKDKNTQIREDNKKDSERFEVSCNELWCTIQDKLGPKDKKKKDKQYE